jgi:hypothetical protein
MPFWVALVSHPKGNQLFCSVQTVSRLIEYRAASVSTREALRADQKKVRPEPGRVVYLAIGPFDTLVKANEFRDEWNSQPARGLYTRYRNGLTICDNTLTLAV